MNRSLLLKSGLKKDWLVCFLVLILFVTGFSWGTRFRSQSALRTPLWFDEAYNLQIPAQFLASGKYSTFPSVVLSDEGRTGASLFDSAITTGPSVLLPIAWLAKVTGHSSVVTSGRKVQFLFVSFFVLLVPIGLFMRTGNLLILIPALLVSTWIANAGYWARIMTEVLGEGPGLVYLICSILIAYSGVKIRSAFLVILAGAFCALSIHAKLIYLLVWFGAFLWVVLSIMFKLPERLSIRDCTHFLFGFIGLCAIWQFYQMIQLGGPSEYFAHQLGYVGTFFSISGGPVSKITVGSEEWFALTWSKWKTVCGIMSEHCHILGSSLLSLIGVLVFSFKRTLRIGNSANANPWKALVCGAFIYHAWFIFASALGWPRHFLPAWAILNIALVCWCLEVYSQHFSFSLLREREKILLSGLLILICISISLIRMSKPTEGALAIQHKNAKKIAEIEKKYYPAWISQVRAGEAIDAYPFFTESRISPYKLETLDKDKTLCEMFKPNPNKIYALFSRNNQQLPNSLWRCMNSFGTEEFDDQTGMLRLEFCSGSELVCKN